MVLGGVLSHRGRARSIVCIVAGDGTHPHSGEAVAAEWRRHIYVSTEGALHEVVHIACMHPTYQRHH